jgi:glycine/D-amino acid oxidase-like deaminating enzyme/nitrite reductase/ring-hydroxylating ferredoxin subunit
MPANEGDAMSSIIPRPRSLWNATVDMPIHAPLATNLTAEVCVVGAGIAGLTTAYLLAREGMSVVLVEARQLGEGETAHTTAHLAVPDDRYYYIEESYGERAAKHVADSFAAAIDLVESIVATERIDCAFQRVDGYLISCAAYPEEELAKELAAASRAGVRVARQERAPWAQWCTGPALRFADQAQFHPLRYLAGLARAVERHRAAIYLDTRVLNVEEREDRVVVTTTSSKITADHVVVATNTPINDRVKMHTKLAAHQTYVVAARIERGSMPRVLMWDDGDPYHYVRTAEIDDSTEVLIVGGEDHKTGQERNPEDRYAALITWMREHFPQAGEITHRWSGEVMEPLDGIAYLGRNPGNDRVYVITGDSGNGMTHATAGAILITDLIAGRPNPWLATYDPARKAFKEALEFAKEQANNAAQYTDWISGGDVASTEQISVGEGALIRDGLKKLAVFRDEDGSLHANSAVCPHLGCIVQWNTSEKTWDCPCHGSRFSRFGSVLHGPAVSGLAAAEAPVPPPPHKRTPRSAERPR